jgi:hypothetical protein
MVARVNIKFLMAEEGRASSGFLVMLMTVVIRPQLPLSGTALVVCFAVATCSELGAPLSLFEHTASESIFASQGRRGAIPPNSQSAKIPEVNQPAVCVVHLLELQKCETPFKITVRNARLNRQIELEDVLQSSQWSSGCQRGCHCCCDSAFQ